MKENQIAKNIKKQLDNHINKDGNKSSILQFNLSTTKSLQNIDLLKLFNEAKNLGFYMDYIKNTKLKNDINPKLHEVIIIASYDESL